MSITNMKEDVYI